MNRYIILLLFFSTLIGFGATQYKSSTPEWKNLQVLPKDISDEKLDSIMDDFKISLGVKCGFCHARNADTSIHKLDFASDANEVKDVARYMMKMTDSINHTYFVPGDGNKNQPVNVVICYTCHRGTNEPSSKKLIPTMPVEQH